MARENLSHNELFALVLDELFTQFSDTYPSADLIRAAERLAVLIDADFNLLDTKPEAQHANYYSHELDWAFTSMVWRIACREKRNDLLEDQRLSRDEQAKRNLRGYLDSW